MTIKELKKGIKGVFKLPKRKFYLGRVKFGCPYFYPRNFVGTIFAFYKCKYKDKSSWNYFRGYSRAWKIFKFKIGNYLYSLEIGAPIKTKITKLGWKDKYGTPRHEWSPSFDIYFFLWQFRVYYTPPGKCDWADTYWEMVLWYLFFSDKDIKKAEETWGWTSEGKSTWDKDYLITEPKEK